MERSEGWKFEIIFLASRQSRFVLDFIFKNLYIPYAAYRNRT